LHCGLKRHKIGTNRKLCAQKSASALFQEVWICNVEVLVCQKKREVDLTFE